MQKIGFAEALDSIVTSDPRYQRDAYIFLRDALDFTTKTDERGHWFLDIASGPITPQTQVNFDFFFEIPGRQTVWLRMTPTSSTVFNLVLRKT